MQISTPFPFEFIITLGWLGFFLVLGVILRSKIPFFKNYLIPACLIGGVIGMICNMLGLFGTGFFKVSQDSISMIAFHFFGLYFGAAALNVSDSPVKTHAATNFAKRTSAGAFWLASIQFTVQQVMVLVCVGIMLGLNAFMGTDYIASTGQLLANGFASGPGPAMTTGKVWDTFLGEGRNLAGLGLSAGSLGFIFAYIIGLPLANYFHRKRNAQAKMEIKAGKAERDGYYVDNDGPSIGTETLHAANVDTMAFQFGIILVIYLLASFIAYSFIGLLGNSPAVGMVWGLFFMIPLISGLIVKTILKKTGYFHLINQKLNRRIMGGLIDFIVLSSFFGIAIENLQNYWLFIILGIAGICIALCIFVPLLTRNVNNFREERILYITGLLTGTGATGLFLTRIIDPEGKSPLPFEVALGNIFVLILAAPLAFVGYMEVMFGYTIWQYLAAIAVSLVVYFCAAQVATKLLNKQYKNEAE